MFNWIKQDKSIFVWMPTIVWLSVILVFAVLPCKTGLPFTVGYVDKIAHFFEFMVLAVLMVRSLRFATSFSVTKSSLFTLISVGGYGIVMELLQLYVPGRNACQWDIMANVVGVVFGVILGEFVLWRK